MIPPVHLRALRYAVLTHALQMMTSHTGWVQAIRTDPELQGRGASLGMSDTENARCQMLTRLFDALGYGSAISRDLQETCRTLGHIPLSSYVFAMRCPVLTQHMLRQAEAKSCRARTLPTQVELRYPPTHTVGDTQY